MFRTAVVTALTLQVVMPMSVAAQTGDTKAAELRGVPKQVRTTEVATVSCDRIVMSADKVLVRYDERMALIAEKREAHRVQLDEKKAVRVENLAEIEAKHDARRDQRFTELLERDIDDAKRQALIVFQAAVKDAVSARRTAMQSATTAFHEGVVASAQGHVDAVDTAAANLHDALIEAVETAKADCDSGADLSGVREVLQASLRDARLAYRTEMEAANSVRTDVAELNNVRREVMDAARESFRSSLESAKTDLRIALDALRPDDADADVDDQGDGSNEDGEGNDG